MSINENELCKKHSTIWWMLSRKQFMGNGLPPTGAWESPVPRAWQCQYPSKVRIGANCHKAIQPEKKMSTLLIIIILLLLFGGGGGYYAYGNYGGSGLGGVLGTVLVILLILWLLGVLR
jgi:hypothetical protein